ncbi:MAG: beta-ketoacyl-[acyl-carrier-protein] synthase family protein [Bacteroidota bacterium]
MDVFVTGIGIACAIGLDVRETWQHLAAGKTGLIYHPEFDRIAGLVSLTNDALKAQFGYPPEADISRTTLLSLVAATEAWQGHPKLNALRTGFISATSVGGMDRMETYYRRFRSEDGFDMSPLMVFENGGTTEEVAKKLGINGYVSTISTACSSGANAIMQGVRLIRSGRLDRVIAGGVDPVIDYNVKGFSALKIYSQEPCQPFDANRKGLNLGEGAAFLVLESRDSLRQTGRQTLCRVSGWANAADAYHQTATSPNGDGATLSMEGAIRQAGLQASDIDYVNAHGTGTANNDLSESVAFCRVFGQQMPAFSSTKSLTGHTLAAAGAIEAVFSVLALQDQQVWPNLHFKTPIPESGLTPETKVKSASIQHILSNSFGFGGNCTSLVFSKK